MFKNIIKKKQIAHCRKKFLRFFPKGFQDIKYDAWERDYKWQVHLKWEEMLNIKSYKKLLKEKKFEEIANAAVKIETKKNLLFSFEKMALRDAVKSNQGAKIFAEGLFQYVYGTSSLRDRMENFASAISKLPVVKTRVHTWPIQTVFGFIANPNEHIFLKPKVTQAAAMGMGYEFKYHSKPNWDTYKSLLDFANMVRKEMK